MADLTFRDVMGSTVLVVVVITLSLNFSGSIFDAYSVDSDSKTLEKVKDQANNTAPTQNLKSQGENVSVTSGSFLSPQGFSVISNAFGTMVSIPSIFASAIGELGFPPVLVLMGGLVVVALIWELVSVLFGIRT